MAKTKLILPFLPTISTSRDTYVRQTRGEGLQPGEIPDKFYVRYYDRKQGTPPELFWVGMFFCVSSACREVLEQFDIGGSSFHPCVFFQNDRVTTIGDGYSVFNVNSRKDALVPDRCRNIEALGGWVPPQWMFTSLVKDNDIAVSGAGLIGQDLWVDVRLARAFFVSNSLALALSTAGLGRQFVLLKCTVVE